MVIIKVFPYFCRLNSYRQTTNFNMNKCSVTLVFALIVATLTTWAQGPNNSGTYYQPANGKSGQALKTALYNIIKNPSVVSYDGLIKAYEKTDTRADGYVRDWYSNATNFRHGTDKAGSYSEEGDCYNREHSIPQSWFSKASPMKSDIVHVIPTDGYVNNRRSSYPFGEVGEVTYQSKNKYSKLGRCKTEGYSGIVFEPNDEIKGDIARIYFYMATCYEDKILNWQNGTSSSVISGTKYQPYSQWTFDMLMRWSKQDPVDNVERDRNNAVYGVQNNRNPFVDYPGLEELIWGDRKTEAFDYTKGCRFATYGSRCVENEILMHFRSLKKSALDRHFDDPVDSDKDGNQLCLIDLISDGSDVAGKIELVIRCEQLYRFIETELDERERTIIRLRYGLDNGRALTQREVADRLDISRSYVSRIEKKALETLRKKYEGK